MSVLIIISEWLLLVARWLVVHEVSGMTCLMSIWFIYLFTSHHPCCAVTHRTDAVPLSFDCCCFQRVLYHWLSTISIELSDLHACVGHWTGTDLKQLFHTPLSLCRLLNEKIWKTVSTEGWIRALFHTQLRNSSQLSGDFLQLFSQSHRSVSILNDWQGKCDKKNRSHAWSFHWHCRVADIAYEEAFLETSSGELRLYLHSRYADGIRVLHYSWQELNSSSMQSIHWYSTRRDVDRWLFFARALPIYEHHWVQERLNCPKTSGWRSFSLC